MPPLTNKAWHQGRDDALSGKVFDPRYGYQPHERAEYRIGYTYGHDERVAQKSRPQRRAFKG